MVQKFCLHSILQKSYLSVKSALVTSILTYVLIARGYLSIGVSNSSKEKSMKETRQQFLEQIDCPATTARNKSLIVNHNFPTHVNQNKIDEQCNQ